MAWKISYSITTGPRGEPYLDRTIESLEKSGFFENKENLPLRLVPHNLDSKYLDAYRKDKRFYVEEISPREACERMWSQAGAPLRETWGHYRCLHPERAAIDANGVLVLEDDLKFGKEWLVKLQATANELASLYGRRWLLTLYSPGTREPIDASRTGVRRVVRSYNGFYGSQAILYPLGVRDEYMAYIAGHPTDKPHDLMLPEAMKALNIPLFTSAPCLVQHVELDSGEMKAHHSDSFVE